MLNAILEKIKYDQHIIRAIKEKQKQKRKKLWVYAAAVMVFILLLGLVAQFSLRTWIIALAVALAAAFIPFCFVCRDGRKEKVFMGKIEKIEAYRRTVPQKGTGAFGLFHNRVVEVYELVIAITDDRGETRVIFCPPQHEIVLKVGDILLTHSKLPYPAHMSNPTKCICMHCGTMQSAENESCITCGADMYSLHTVKE